MNAIAKQIYRQEIIHRCFCALYSICAKDLNGDSALGPIEYTQPRAISKNYAVCVALGF